MEEEDGGRKTEREEKSTGANGLELSLEEGIKRK